MSRLVNELSTYQKKEVANSDGRTKFPVIVNPTLKSSIDYGDNADGKGPRTIPSELKSALSTAVKNRDSIRLSSSSTVISGTTSRGFLPTQRPHAGPTIAATRLLGSVLGFVGDALQQLVNGLSTSFAANSLPTDLTNAVEMDRWENGELRLGLICFIHSFFPLFLISESADFIFIMYCVEYRRRFVDINLFWLVSLLMRAFRRSRRTARYSPRAFSPACCESHF